MDALMLKHVKEVVDEHSIPLQDPNTAIIEAAWLVDVLTTLQAVYSNDGS
jgi:hypothetical protein